VPFPVCAHLDYKLIDSREGRTGDPSAAAANCLKCSQPFTTYERIDEIPYHVIKKGAAASNGFTRRRRFCQAF